MSRVVIHVEQLMVRFGGHTALDNVNLRIMDGELHGLIGPNGAGKSTLFRCLTGLLRPTRGTVHIDGVPIITRQVHEIAALGVGIKTQIPSLMENLSAEEHLWLSLRRRYDTHGATRGAIRTLDELGFSNIKGKPLSQLAHGQRQMVEFAMIMAQQPKLVLLDEPAAGLSDSERGQLADMIRAMNETATVVVVEHDMHFIRDIARKVTVLHRGQILRQADAETVLRDPVVRDVYFGEDAA